MFEHNSNLGAPVILLREWHVQFDLLGILDRSAGMLILSAEKYVRVSLQKFNVNMIGLTYDSFCKGNEYYFMWSYHSMDRNW